MMSAAKIIQRLSWWYEHYIWCRWNATSTKLKKRKRGTMIMISRAQNVIIRF